MLRFQKDNPGVKLLLGHYAQVYRICLGLSKDPHQAEELLQEVYLRALQNLGSLRDRSRAREWLFRIARNTCLNFLKKQTLRQNYRKNPGTLPESSPSPESQFMEREDLFRLKQTVNSLPRRQKEILVLREYGQLSYQEIAACLRIKPGTVMSRLNRARQTVLASLHGGNDEQQK
jgi:RNA polymerase sigma-70 factor (ECF subfamily)